MNFHISLLEAHHDTARIVFHIVIAKQLVFEKELTFRVGETFNLRNFREVIIDEHMLENRYDVRFSDN